ncbi:FAD-dependent oxidoreductase [Actinoallomurus sp. NBC_01490]|jgi:NADPH-dependent 2,4-dienoyl-CoA reductase/sulfur reductase-like enzyme/ferredoxin|uniref:FAD-dependent oxidoreductase n=1 Tax=Actinoallomurus sp. NBC_01490 TaxID=2903557 RepID=UPI002E3390E9|nr:FAD-dependent oxidoreductase [Actinoallomurus sp. NBC_01490]
MRVIVDLTRCQGYGQCAFLAPEIFAMRGEEALMYDPDADDAQREHVLRAVAACPVQAIHVEWMAVQHKERRAAAVRPQLGDDGLRKTGRVVIVGASLAGGRAAGVLRREGFTGALTVIGGEPYEPYDRPPLSKQVLAGGVPADHTLLPHLGEIEAEWLSSTSATGLDLAAKRVRLDDGREVPFDRLLIATGARARPWPNEDEAALDGVLALRTMDEAVRLRERFAAGPRRVLVIGAGFTGSEVASVCRELDVPVTVVERGPAPLAGALGGVIGSAAADLQRAHGVDLRCGVTVEALQGDADGRFRAARLSDGTTVEADVAVVALGAIRNVEWLEDSGLAAGVWGVACDAGCRAFDINGLVTDDVFVAGDVARFPHPVYNYQFMALEHWGNAVAQAEIAAHNMLSDQMHRWPHLSLPVFWSNQFGTNIKSVGVPTFADEVAIAHGSVAEHRFVAVYGHRGRVTAAVTFDQAMWLEHYQHLIERAAPFPPASHTADRREPMVPVRAEVPERIEATQVTVMVTGHDPAERRATLVRGER